MSTSGVNKGWLRRVFGTMELEPGAEPGRVETHIETEQTKQDLEELLATAARRVEESDVAQACMDALERDLSEARAELERRREAQSGAEARLAAAQADAEDLRRELQRSTAVQIDAQRKAEVRGAELDKLRKSLKVLEQQRAELDERCTRLTSDAEVQARESKALREKVELAERVVSALKAELERARKRSDQALAADQTLESVRKELEQARAEASSLEPLRRANEGLELALASAKAEAARAREVMQGLQKSAEAELSRLVELELELERRDEAARHAELTLQGSRRELLGLVSLAARALDVTLGDDAHLALEVAFGERARAVFGASARMEHGAAASTLRAHLAELGLATSCQLELEGDELIGRLALSPALSEGEANVMARWLAAYATEWLNQQTHADRRLEQLEDAPGGIVWKATSRRLASAR